MMAIATMKVCRAGLLASRIHWVREIECRIVIINIVSTAVTRLDKKTL